MPLPTFVIALSLRGAALQRYLYNYGTYGEEEDRWCGEGIIEHQNIQITGTILSIHIPPNPNTPQPL